MARRERIDIVLDMLTAIRDKGGKIKPTHLMYKANLTHRQMKSYLDDLVNKNFMGYEKIKDAKYILITDEGRKFIEKIYEMQDFEKMFGIE
jgi:predicted transcriptional regulator